MLKIGCLILISKGSYSFRFAKENVLRFLIGNKCDLGHKRAISFEQGQELGNK